MSVPCQWPIKGCLSEWACGWVLQTHRIYLTLTPHRRYRAEVRRHLRPRLRHQRQTCLIKEKEKVGNIAIVSKILTKLWQWFYPIHPAVEISLKLNLWPLPWPSSLKLNLWRLPWPSSVWSNLNPSLLWCLSGFSIFWYLPFWYLANI